MTAEPGRGPTVPRLLRSLVREANQATAEPGRGPTVPRLLRSLVREANQATAEPGRGPTVPRLLRSLVREANQATAEGRRPEPRPGDWSSAGEGRPGIIRVVGTRERPADRGRRRANEALRHLGADFRQARVGAGLSLRDVASASGASHAQLWRFERGQLRRLDLPGLGAWCSTVGLELSLRSYPAGDPIRDRAQVALLERLRTRLHPSLQWRAEVPLPGAGDLRAWDAEITGGQPRRWRVLVEAETAITDGQALLRRLQLKVRDDPNGRAVLLVADTRRNRHALRALTPGLAGAMPLGTREILRALGAGRDPGQAGVAVL